MATLTTSTVDTLRRDFLVLMRNVELVKDYETAKVLDKVFRTYAARFYNLIYRGLTPHLVKNGDPYWDKRVREDTWRFYTELRLPLEPLMDPPYSPGKSVLFARFERARDKWVRTITRYARKAWTALRDLLAGRDTVEFADPTSSLIDIVGFKVEVVGWKPKAADYLDRLSGGLRWFKERARKVFPPLLTPYVRFVLNLHDKEDIGDGAAATYGDNTINLSFWIATDPKGSAKILAHEMGHHVYRTYLSGDDKALWTALQKGDIGTLDLRDVLAVWPENGSPYWIVDNPLKETDPVLYLQIYTAMLPHDRDRTWFTTKAEVETLIASGKTTIQVFAHPITVYAATNPEEAFCEALGLLVAYGPRAVDPVVRQWLQTILPNLRVAHAGRVASRYLHGA